MTTRLIVVPALAARARLPIVRPAAAHEIRPAFLQIGEVAPGVCQLHWKVPARHGMVQDIRPGFDPGLTPAPRPGATVADGFALFRYALTGGPFPRTTLRIHGPERSTIHALVDISLADGGRHSVLLRPRDAAIALAEMPSARSVTATCAPRRPAHPRGGRPPRLFRRAAIGPGAAAPARPPAAGSPLRRRLCHRHAGRGLDVRAA